MEKENILFAYNIYNVVLMTIVHFAYVCDHWELFVQLGSSNHMYIHCQRDRTAVVVLGAKAESEYQAKWPSNIQRKKITQSHKVIICFYIFTP